MENLPVNPQGKGAVCERDGRIPPPSVGNRVWGELNRLEVLCPISRTFLFVKFLGTVGVFLCNQLAFAGFIQLRDNPMLVISQFITIMNQKEEADYKPESFYFCEIAWQLAPGREAAGGCRAPRGTWGWGSAARCASPNRNLEGQTGEIWGCSPCSLSFASA